MFESESGFFHRFNECKQIVVVQSDYFICSEFRQNLINQTLQINQTIQNLVVKLNSSIKLGTVSQRLLFPIPV